MILTDEELLEALNCVEPLYIHDDVIPTVRELIKQRHRWESEAIRIARDLIAVREELQQLKERSR